VVSGPVTLRFRGRMAEKLLDRARAEGIQIDSAERVNERETILRTGEADARRILELAERYKLDVKILRVGGFPRIKQTLRQRLAMALSLAILLSALAILSGRAWLVEVKLTGAQPENLSRAMRASGVHVGMNLTGLDAYALSQRLLSEAGDLAYVGVRVTGVRLLIEAIGEAQPPALYDLDAARDLRAVQDGVVETVTVLYGVAAVKPGDTVRRGQTLIRGEEKITDELTRGVCALGSVVARTESALACPFFRLPLISAQPYRLEKTEETFLPVGGLYFPLGVARIRHQELAERQILLNEDAVKREISEKALREAQTKRPQSSTEIDKWVDYSMIEGGGIRARASIELRMNIAA
jgi:hypothetical protein